MRQLPHVAQYAASSKSHRTLEMAPSNHPTTYIAHKTGLDTSRGVSIWPYASQQGHYWFEQEPSDCRGSTPSTLPTLAEFVLATSSAGCHSRHACGDFVPCSTNMLFDFSHWHPAAQTTQESLSHHRIHRCDIAPTQRATTHPECPNSSHPTRRNPQNPHKKQHS